MYSVDGRLGGAYLRKVLSVLQEMTDLSRELEDVFSHRFRNSLDALSGVTTRLTLSCHSVRNTTIVDFTTADSPVHHRYHPPAYTELALGTD